ncbi:DUF192 domain-containing protein [Egicoccus sp. AB-alg2]|uniref:DUF192 domain-containing protein n=1 Tax=Egicoccus sp. AB-alg2 TaxID=3242693 RepID=UPI00359D0D25
MRRLPRPLSVTVLVLTLAAGCAGTADEPATTTEAPPTADDGQTDEPAVAADEPAVADDEPAVADDEPATTDDGAPEATSGGEVPPLHPSVDDYPEARVELTGADATEVLHVKLADTADRRQHGLMEVEELPDGTGMLFVFEDERTGGFWMKNTLVPLDIAYVGPDGEIRSILAMEPCTEDPCEVYDPGLSYQSALEVPQGWFAQVGIEEGDELTWEPVPTAGGDTGG